ncbi:MAG: B12-binding domain-containing radical SAM protein [Ignavibacteriaceae bacterium]|nr:B12-binding domain-containing radical SAM protein [Ignavibacteriaceae bacterium]
MSKVILFNPRSANSKHRIPNSILQVGASIEGRYDYVFVDGNLEKDPLQKIKSYLSSGEFKYFGCTVMPGLQPKQAIPFTKKVREEFPQVINIWGGYFPANQYKAVLNSGYVDYVINGPGDEAFPQLIDSLERNSDPSLIKNLIFKRNGEFIKTPKADLLDQDLLPPLPYEKLNKFYPIRNYLGKTFLGTKTAAYHSSVGCPFTCSFCAVVPIYEARWKGKSAPLIYKDVKYLKDEYGANAVEFHDNNFFVSENRTVEFSKLIKKENIVWWGEGRIDTIHKYSDESLALMREAGCRMIFFGAETGNDAILKQMDKGGTQSGEQIKKFAERMKKFGIIPEYSFVLGLPAETPEKVMQQIDEDIQFIKQIKEINPDTEIIIYVYSPVPTEGSELYNEVVKTGFRFPEKLDDWLDPQWANFDLRKNPLTPWLTPEMVNKILNFETVINAQYPTVSDFKLTSFQKSIMRFISSFRYRTGFYNFPYELKALQKFWLKYRRPEVEGFYTE